LGQLGPDVLPVVGAQVAETQLRLKAIQLPGQRRPWDPKPAQDLIEVLLANPSGLSQGESAFKGQHWQWHSPKSSTQLDFFKPETRFSF